MRKTRQGILLYSPTDIVRFLESPYASWMERFYLEHPELVSPDEDSEELKLIADEGLRHEARFLEQLRSDGRHVTQIAQSAGSMRETREAMTRGDEVIFQAHVAADGFAGYADFLAMAESRDGYEVWDTKLARSPKPSYLIQLCCYAEIIEKMGCVRPSVLRVVLGNGEFRTFRTADYFYAYLEAKRGFLDQMNAFDPENPPTPDPRADHGRWASHASRQLIASDHLVQVAGITSGQIKKLEAAGVTTLAALADTPLESVTKLNQETFERLRHQARLQMATRNRQSEEPMPVRPAYEILPHSQDTAPGGLELMPPSSPNDIYFDLEGYPLAGQGQGLEYLFGATYLDASQSPQFIDWWAHSQEEEKVAFEAFVDWAYARWVDDPSMHIYHYAPYEITAMKRLMGQYATREQEVDDLLRNGVFVDLYQVVRQGVRLGEDSYSLKKVERLYMDSRDGDVQTAAASIVFYARWIESGEPDDWQNSAVLTQIRDYNREDCDSTWMLAEWLRARQEENGISWRPTNDHVEAPLPTVLPEAVIERQQLALSLLESAHGADTEDSQISTLLAHLLEYHRREDKPVWWSMFERCGMTHEELVEDSDCLGDLRRTGDSPVSIKRSTGFWYAFDPTQDTKLAEGDSAIMAPGREAKLSIATLDSENGRVLLKLGNASLAKKLDGVVPDRLSLIPDEFVNPEPMPTSVRAIAEHWHQHRELPESLRHLLLRLAPINGDESLVADDEQPHLAAVRVAAQMDGATLCIQGPPGTGKTFTGANVIVDLLARGKNVGVVSNSHKAVLNLLDECEDQSPGLVGLKCGGGGSDPLFEQAPGLRYVSSSSAAVDQYSGGLIAGTAWLFAREDMVNRLDYLIVDEAGQVALANLVAMSRSATSIILMGDQMQLAQPVKVSHPGDSGQSALNYYLDGHATIPADLGIFLPETRRMRPEICGVISDAVYEGRLTAHRSTLESEIPGVAAGIAFDPVEHDGNVQESDEESERVARLVDELLGRPYRENGEPSRLLSLDDILIVAPYNRQVRNLQSRLPTGARVGTVDKFQGQQAAVVIVSLAASPGEFGSRGLKFLLDKNRLNVALSRAKCRAILVADPRIAASGFGSIDDMAKVNLFSRISGSLRGSKGGSGSDSDSAITSAWRANLLA